VTVDGVTDTLFNSARGMRADADGNILAAHFDEVFRFDYKTGAGLGRMQPTAGVTLTAPAVDGQGNVFTAPVIPPAAIKIFDKDFNFIGNAVDSSVGFSRSFEVSPDGNTIYWAGYTTHAIYKYTRPDEFSAFTVTDTLLKGFDSESVSRDPNGLLWASAGSYNDLPNRFPGAVTYWKPNTWYAYDPATKQVVDAIEWQFNTPANPNERPRGIAFSPDGNTAYVTCFGADTYPAIQRFVRVESSYPPENKTNFPNDTFTGNSGGHGIAVDPDGKIWFQFYGATDSIATPAGPKAATRVIHVFNPDGSPASFSPIKTVTVDGVTDTLFNSARGLRADADGNILAVHFDEVFRFDYKTGAGLGRMQPTAGVTLTAPAVDAQGNVFTAPVIPPAAIKIFDKDFNFLGNAVDSSVGFSRAFEVSPDGNTIYWAGYTNMAVYKYTRPDEFSSFAVTDTILKGFSSESFCWDPNGLLWASSGSYNDLPNRFPGAATTYKPATWYAYDPATNQIVDFIEWQFNVAANPNERPRGIAFSPDGNTAYVTCFGGSDYPAIQKFSKTGTSVSGKESNWVHVETFQLFQNYPNPFNPQTTIPFELRQAGQVQVKVFDILGREVMTLVDGQMSAGRHDVVFDARSLASGTYYYRIKFGDRVQTKPMLLLK